MPGVVKPGQITTGQGDIGGALFRLQHKRINPFGNRSETRARRERDNRVSCHKLQNLGECGNAWSHILSKQLLPKTGRGYQVFWKWSIGHIHFSRLSGLLHLLHCVFWLAFPKGFQPDWHGRGHTILIAFQRQAGVLCSKLRITGLDFEL